MRKILIKLLLIVIIVGFTSIRSTNSYYVDRNAVDNNNVSTGCWLAPSVPVLLYPADNTYAGPGSAWNLNPYMDWDDSTTTCPLPTTIIYQYESYHDAGLNNLAFRSGWLTNSQIPAPGTPEGSYYWRVRAKDNFGNTSNFSGPWLLVVDRTAPVINNISIASPGETNAKVTISWQTDEDATSNVEWGQTASYGNQSPNPVDTTADKTNHSVDIEGLSDFIEYHFRVKSQDQAGNETVSGDHSFTIVLLPPNPPNFNDIVINEFLPDPQGPDDALMPNGEWVELYNKGVASVDVADWRLCNNISQCIIINNANTDTGSTVIPNHGFLVIYQNGLFPTEWLNNGGDIVYLYTNGGTLNDSRWYFGFPTQEGKSFARFPDGDINWYDPIATPGKPNMLAPTPSQPAASLSIAEDKKTISFSVKNIVDFIKLNYELTYDTDTQSQGIIGEQSLDNQNEFTKDDITLGICSSGGLCTYHDGVKNIKLKVILLDKEDKTMTLESSI